VFPRDNQVDFEKKRLFLDGVVRLGGQKRKLWI